MGTLTKRRDTLRVPVTHGLKDIYAMDMYLPYEAAVAGHFNVTAFSRLAAAIAVVRTALEERANVLPEHVATMDEAIAALSAVRARGDASDHWMITPEELPVVLAGIEAAEACIGILDVALLAQTAELLSQRMATH
ncbi:MAG: hypothetical protein Fur0040_06320 [Sideroxydans sp.]